MTTTSVIATRVAPSVIARPAGPWQSMPSHHRRMDRFVPRDDGDCHGLRPRNDEGAVIARPLLPVIARPAGPWQSLPCRDK